jgi:hypothetical protein
MTTQPPDWDAVYVASTPPPWDIGRPTTRAGARRASVLARAGPYACSSRAGGLLQQIPVTAEVAVDIAARIGLGGQGRYGIRARRRDARRGRDFRQILLLPGISWPDHP